MTRDGWRELVLNTMEKYMNGNAYALELLADLLAEQDAAKAELQRKGYGCTGTPWREMVDEV
jgi:hypothetical protein